jgi:hypothetical protein
MECIRHILINVLSLANIVQVPLVSRGFQKAVLTYSEHKAHDVTGRPKRSATRATACSPHYHPEGEVSTGARQSWDRETEKQLLSQGHQTVKQPSLAH